MKRSIDIESILAPIPGENPAGENLRYSPIYDDIKEARRADDTLDRGDWERELKTSDWEKVIQVSIEALTEKSKDLQIAIWLMEGLIHQEGFEGCTFGLKVLSGFLTDFWDTLYPKIEDDDLDYRIGPLEFVNDKVSLAVSGIAITDPAVSLGYSLINRQEAQQVSQANPKTKEALIADGKLTLEKFETEVNKSSLLFYEKLYDSVAECLEEFNSFDEIIDDKFAREAPRLSEFHNSIEEVKQLVEKIFKEKGGVTPEEKSETDEDAEVSAESDVSDDTGESADAQDGDLASLAQVTIAPFKVTRLLGSGGKVDALWQKALDKLKSSGIEDALELLLGAACSAQSVREQTNCRLLIIKLCIRAGRSDLAWPLAEEINRLISDLSLERWESPTWIADVYGCLYECLTSKEDADYEQSRINELLQKICNTDITMAMKYSK